VGSKRHYEKCLNGAIASAPVRIRCIFARTTFGQLERRPRLIPGAGFFCPGRTTAWCARNRLGVLHLSIGKPRIPTAARASHHLSPDGHSFRPRHFWAAIDYRNGLPASAFETVRSTAPARPSERGWTRHRYARERNPTIRHWLAQRRTTITMATRPVSQHPRQKSAARFPGGALLSAPPPAQYP
jgi:hypothetical protein